MTNPNDPVQPWPNTSSVPSLSKREYMATQIMAGLTRLDTSLDDAEVAQIAVRQTDALIAVLNRSGKGKTKAEYNAENPY